MASRSAEQLSAFAGIDRFGFDEDSRRLDKRLPDGLGASPHFVTRRELFDGPGRVLAIVEIDEKHRLQIASLDERRSRTRAIHVPPMRMETVIEESPVFLTLPISPDVFRRFCRRETPSIGQRLSADTTDRQAFNSRHQHILGCCDAGTAVGVYRCDRITLFPYF
jgi:hypothetical protein